MAPLDALTHLVGMQAQAPLSPYVGLWARLQRFRADDLAELLTNRSAVRIALMRSTIHLVTAEDCLALRPVLQSSLEQFLQSSAHARRLVGVDRTVLKASARALLEARPMTLAHLGPLLSKRFGGRPPEDLAYAVRALVPLVQIPPRGVWGRGGMPVLATAEMWLGRPMDPEPSVDAVVRRYLGAFGPASTADIRAWSGMTRLKDVVERLRPALRVFRDERQTELFDLPEAPRPSADISAPVRFLPEFDNLLLSHAYRTRVTGDAHRERALRSLGKPMLLVDGFVAGTWKVARVKLSATLLVTPFARLSKADWAAVAEEGMRLLAFVEPNAHTSDVRFDTP
jgi:hypothetical protein